MNFEKIRKRLEELEKEDREARFLVTLETGEQKQLTALDFWLLLLESAAEAAPAITDAVILSGSPDGDPLQERIKDACSVLKW